VICGEIEKTADTFDTITNPTVIIEVLSDSTKDYDRGSKFTLYREIPHLKEYLLIDATGKVSVEHFSKNTDGLWVLKEYKEMDNAVFIPAIDVTLLVSDLYSGVY
jgi:Uma2 family endonuclease